MKSWCIGQPSAHYVAKMEDVLEVYHRAYDPRRPIVCLDERSKELHSTPRGTLPMRPGREAYQDYEYERHGVCNLFLAVEPLRGWRRVSVTARRTAQDFAERLRQLVDEDYPDAEQIILVTDNLNTHTKACLYERFEPAEARRIAAKIEWHYTPEHGSWRASSAGDNVAECELSVLSTQCLKRDIPDQETLATEVLVWATRRNHMQVRIDWQFTTDDARIKLKRLYPVLKEQPSC